MKAARSFRTLTTAFVFAALAATGKAQLGGIHWAYNQDVNFTPYEGLLIAATFHNDSGTELSKPGAAFMG